MNPRGNYGHSEGGSDRRGTLVPGTVRTGDDTGTTGLTTGHESSVNHKRPPLCRNSTPNLPWTLDRFTSSVFPVTSDSRVVGSMVTTSDVSDSSPCPPPTVPYLYLCVPSRRGSTSNRE